MSSHHDAPLLDFLQSLEGLYAGPGRTTDGFEFRGRLSLQPKVRGNVVELAFRAEDHDAAFHEEATWISADLISNEVAMWTVSSNTPGVLRHELVRDEAVDGFARRLLFRLGDPDDKRRFRQEIGLDLKTTGEIEYHYSWGVPHEDMKPRVHAKLVLVESSLKN